MIKKIHYCWFGSTEPDAVKRNVESWHKLNPDFEIVAWNEDNIDVSGYEFGRRALENKRWGFLVDTIRPKALIEQGGFYVDADIEIVSPLNRLEEYGDKMIMGYMYDCALGTAMLYSPPQHPYMLDIIKKYDRIRPNFWPVSNSIFTEYFNNEVDDFLLTGKRWENDRAVIFQKEFFEQPAFTRTKGIAVHHCCGSWASPEGQEFGFNTSGQKMAHYIMWAKRQIRAYRSKQNNEFIDQHRAALRGEQLGFPTDKFYVDSPQTPTV